MQTFLAGYVLISICEIFSVGEFPLGWKARVVSHCHPSPRGVLGVLFSKSTLANQCLGFRPFPPCTSA